jgi:hypothetical protein
MANARTTRVGDGHRNRSYSGGASVSESDENESWEDDMDRADTSTCAVPTSTPARLRDANILGAEVNRGSIFDEYNRPAEKAEGSSGAEEGVEDDDDRINTIDDFRRGARLKSPVVSMSLPSPPTLRKTTKKSVPPSQRPELGRVEQPVVSSSYAGKSHGGGVEGERTGTWYSEMIARCRSQLKQQEVTLAAIRKSQQLSREKRDEANASMRSLSSSYSHGYSSSSPSRTLSSVASFLRSSEEAVAGGSRPKALYPEMLSPSDTKVLMDGVFRRSLGSLKADEVSGVGDVGKLGEAGEVGGAAERRVSSRNREDRMRKSLRYDTMEVPASSPRRSLVGSSM